MDVHATGRSRWTATGLERPVFLDESGRRGRAVRVAGGLVALLVCGWVVALMAGAVGFGTLPALPIATAARHVERVARAAPDHAHGTRMIAFHRHHRHRAARED